jgi:hypothetical protein
VPAHYLENCNGKRTSNFIGQFKDERRNFDFFFKKIGRKKVATDVNLILFSNAIANAHARALTARGTHTNRLTVHRVPHSVSPVHEEEHPRRFFPFLFPCFVPAASPSTTTPSSPAPPSPPTLTHFLASPLTHTHSDAQVPVIAKRAEEGEV